MPEAISMTNYTLGVLNANLGANFRASTMVGGDPAAINSTGFWESMAQYEAFRAAIQEDQEAGTAMRLGAHLFADDMHDTMWQVKSDPGEADNYAVITSARMNLANAGDAIAFATEAASVVSGITGRSVGLASAMTGDISRLTWVGYAPDLTTVESNEQALQASADYAAIFAKAEDLMVPDTFESTIWHNQAA